MIHRGSFFYWESRDTVLVVWFVGKGSHALRDSTGFFSLPLLQIDLGFPDPSTFSIATWMKIRRHRSSSTFLHRISHVKLNAGIVPLLYIAVSHGRGEWFAWGKPWRKTSRQGDQWRAHPTMRAVIEMRLWIILSDMQAMSCCCCYLWLLPLFNYRPIHMGAIYLRTPTMREKDGVSDSY